MRLQEIGDNWSKRTLQEYRRTLYNIMDRFNSVIPLIAGQRS